MKTYEFHGDRNMAKFAQIECDEYHEIIDEQIALDIEHMEGMQEQIDSVNQEIEEDTNSIFDSL